MVEYIISLEILDDKGPNWFYFTWNKETMRMQDRHTSLIIDAKSVDEATDKVLDLGEGTVKILNIEEYGTESTKDLKDMIDFLSPKSTEEVLQHTLSNPIGISNN